MTAEILTSAIVGHLVGDYLIQNDWMAQNKKKHILPCMVHCLLWTVAVMLFSGMGWRERIVGIGGVIFICLFITHFIQDHTNIVKFYMEKVIRQPIFVKPPLAPWSIIVVDNVWHIVTIWIVWRFIA